MVILTDVERIDALTAELYADNEPSFLTEAQLESFLPADEDPDTCLVPELVTRD